MRVSQEDSTVKKTHAAMKTVCRRCGGDTDGQGNELLRCDMPGCGAGYHMWCQSATGSAPIATITSPTCGRHSRRRTALRYKPQPPGSLGLASYCGSLPRCALASPLHLL